MDGLGTGKRLWFILGCLSAGIGVLLGAFGAHSLKARVTPDLLKNWETAANYQFIHALGLILVSFAPKESKIAGWAFTFGSILFSGSLYALVLTGNRKFGAITPIGGTAFIIGWFVLAFQGTF